MEIDKNSVFYNYHDSRWRKIINSSNFDNVINKGFIINNRYIKTINLRYENQIKKYFSKKDVNEFMTDTKILYGINLYTRQLKFIIFF